MTKAHDTTGARVLVGIDISKHRHEVLIAAPGKMVHHPEYVSDEDILPLGAAYGVALTESYLR